MIVYRARSSIQGTKNWDRRSGMEILDEFQDTSDSYRELLREMLPSVDLITVSPAWGRFGA